MKKSRVAAIVFVSIFSCNSCMLPHSHNMLPAYSQKPGKEDRQVTLKNYGSQPMTLCVAASPTARCKCQTINAGKQVRLKLDKNENERIIKIFNSPSDTSCTKYKAHGGNTYGFTYNSGTAQWQFITN